MFASKMSIVSLALAAASSVSSIAVPLSGAHVVRRSHHGLVARAQQPPAGWAYGYLEDYDTYHVRYIALDCEGQHNTTFFDQCCHPLLATEQLSSRPAQCTPSPAASSSAAAADGTSTVTTPDEPSSTAPPPSSTPAPPPPSTSAAPAKNTFAPKSSSSSAAPAATSSSSSVLGDLITGGVATFFFQNGVAGACGTVHSDQDLIAAIDQDRYGSSGGASSLCGKQVQITNTQNQKTVVVTIADDCPTCNNGNSIDLSQGAFNQIATAAQGEVPIAWKFL